MMHCLKEPYPQRPTTDNEDRADETATDSLATTRERRQDVRPLRCSVSGWVAGTNGGLARRKREE